MTTAHLLRGLYVLTDAVLTPGEQLLAAVAAAIDGGAAVVQYRNKSGDTMRQEAEAAALLALCRERGVPLIVNDDVALAARIGADGVHVGREDPDLHQARAALGRSAIIGVSCYDDLERARRAQAEGADYVAFGSFFASPTKPAAVPASLDLLRKARSQLNVPVAAIGGITPDNGAQLVAAGADLLAVITGVFAQPDIRAAARRYAALFDKR
jgi:thiamine-phosphate pyrophosphorylase